jgi:hypothetical protein
MQILFWIWLGIVLKIPVVAMCVFIYRVVNDTPDQVIGDDEGGSGVRFEQGPRVRGPQDGRTPFKRGPRRGNYGHDEAPGERQPDRSSEHV